MSVELDKTAPAGTITATAAAPTRVGATSAGLAAGRQLGHFRIERPLGIGGMGEVYLATDLSLDRSVAVKVLPESLARDPVRRDRMIREARAQARVVHPNVGHIYFVGEQEGLLYFAMEYVVGQTLAERLANGPLPVDDALAFVRDAALGLREAQRSGITHRDVKPSNLMVDAHGQLKVMDFGLAAGDPGTPTEGPVAQTTMAGTPLYMAPEQARGEPVDHRADIYALGATLFHLVAGHPPFQAGTVEELLTMHSSAERPRIERKDQPRTSLVAVDALCARMMATRAEDRFASYDELLRAIELASVTQGRPAGASVRAIAAGVDTLLLFLLLLFADTMLELATGRVYPTFAPWFTLAIPYSVFALARWGRTPGKALFEIEVVEIATGQRPSFRTSLVRTLIILGPPIAFAWIDVLLPDSFEGVANEIIGFFEVFWFLLCAVSLLYASARVHAKRAAWDRWTGTRVRYRLLSK